MKKIDNKLSCVLYDLYTNNNYILPISIMSYETFTISVLFETINNKNNVEIFGDLVKNYLIDVNIRDDHGNTAMHAHLMCYGGHCLHKQTTMLINYGIDINIQNNNGDSPLLISSRKGYRYSTPLLLKAGANPFIKNKYGECAIDYIKKNKYLLNRCKTILNGSSLLLFNEEQKEELVELGILYVEDLMLDAIKSNNYEKLLKLCPDLQSYINDTNRSNEFCTIEVTDDTLNLTLKKNDSRTINIDYE